MDNTTGLDSNCEELLIDTRNLELCLGKIISTALARHDNYLWIDAASLVIPSGHSVMIAGASGSGKTTLSAALAATAGCAVVADDVTLIEPKPLAIVSFQAPFRLRPGTAELIAGATGVKPPVVMDYWLANVTTCQRIAEASFDLILLLEGAPNIASGPMLICETTPADLVRRTLPISNALRVPKGTELLARCFNGAKCLLVRGGSLAERMRLVCSGFPS